MNSEIRRNITNVVHEYLSFFPVVLIEGARQVGKSTLARQLAPDGFLLSLDVPDIADAVRADQMGTINQQPHGVTIIDEIQYLPELTRALKASVDRNRRPGRFILTGSASLLAVRGTQDSLAGRVGRLNLFGFSQGELHGVRDDFAAYFRQLFDSDGGIAEADHAVLSFQSVLTRTGYIRLCASGSYPQLQDLTERMRRRWLRDYVTSIVNRDLGELRRSVQPKRALSVLKVLGTQQESELVKAHLARETSIPETSLSSYLDLLESVQLVKLILPWSGNLTKREIGKAKGLVLDSALAMYLAGITEDQLENLLYQETFGALLEGYVVAELLKQQTWSETDFSLWHYRESTGTEVDIVLEFADGAVLALEVKAASSYSAAQFKGLAKLRDGLGERFLGGVVLTTADHGYRYADRLWGLPISALWQSKI